MAFYHLTNGPLEEAVERYSRSLGALTPAQLEMLRRSRVLVAGCGGLGGYLVELAARLGVGSLTVADGDVFEASNLNRQLLSTEALLGKSKARAAAARVRAVNSDVEVRAVAEYLTEDNAAGLVTGHDLALDALDSVAARKLLASACAKEGIPMVHGAVCGWNAQVCTVPPGSDILARLYANGASRDKSTLPFTPSLCASLQAAEAVRLLTGQAPILAEKLLLVDLRDMDWRIVRL